MWKLFLFLFCLLVLGWSCGSPLDPRGELIVLRPELGSEEVDWDASWTAVEGRVAGKEGESYAGKEDGPEDLDPGREVGLAERESGSLDESVAERDRSREFVVEERRMSEVPQADLPPREGGGTGVGVACRASGVAGVCRKTKDCTGNHRSVAGLCPGPAEVQCCVPKSSSGSSYCAVKIPASCQPVSSFSQTCNCSVKPPTPLHAGRVERAGQSRCPDGMVRVENFCMDQYEAALVEVLPGGQVQAWSPYLNPGNRSVRAVSIAGVIPQGYISGVQAARACKSAGKRLCTDTEWLRACQGSQKNTFPYGKVKQKGWCNEDRSKHPALEYFGHSRSCVFSYISHICINQLPNSLARTGSHAKCVTKDGVYDMMGNLHEWTSNPSGIFRGGYYVDTYRNGPGCLYRTTAHTANHWDYSTGFRCCSSLRP